MNSNTWGKFTRHPFSP